MAQPGTTGEAIQIIRRALYDLARRPNWHKDGATQQEILNYAIERSLPVPVRDFDKAMARLCGAGAAEERKPWGVADSARVTLSRYKLTASGDLEEEDKRRPWAKHVADEFRRPRTFVDFAVGGALAVLGFVLGLVVRPLFGP